MLITSVKNERIKRIAALKDRKYRREYGEYVVEGVKMVKEAILSSLAVEVVAGLPEVLANLPETSAEKLEVSAEVFAKISDTMTPQGVLAVLKVPENAQKPPVGNCAVLDGIADPGNLGTIIRTCAAVGLEDVYLVNCADAFSPKTIRSSMSGIFYTRIHAFDRETTAQLVSGCRLAVADMGGECYTSVRVEQPYAIVVGNEANGVSEYFLSKADKILSIPMDGRMESLNAAVAFALVAYGLKAANTN